MSEGKRRAAKAGKPRFSLIDGDFWEAVSEGDGASATGRDYDLEAQARARSWAQSAISAAYLMYRGRDPLSAMRLELARVLAHGATVYGANDWRLGADWSLILDAMLRHLDKYERGEVTDRDTGCHHLACFVFGCMVLHCYNRDGLGVDDIDVVAGGVT